MVQDQDESRPSVRIRLCKPYLRDRQSVMALIEEVLDTGLLVQGKYVVQFEQQVATHLGVKHAIAVSSGTAALHLALIASGIGPGDEVIIPAYTFPATANVVELVGARPVFVDVDLDTYNIQVEQIKKVISPKTRGIIPVHLFGNPADMDSIMEIARGHGLTVLEDAAGALGSEYKGRKCGTMGTLGCLSFHPRKIITTGEGGMVLTSDGELAERIRSLRNHGMETNGSRHDFIAAGFNYRMNELEAILGMMQMLYLKDIINERRKLADLYTDLLSKIPNIAVQATEPASTVAVQAFVVRLKRESSAHVVELMRRKGIEVQIGTYALHLLRYYRDKYGYMPSDYPQAAELFDKCIALPFYNGMQAETLQQVVTALEEILT